MHADSSISDRLASTFNDRFRGHDNRNWDEWQTAHAYASAAEIPPNAERAWIGRQNLNYRGIGERTKLRHLIASNVDQSFLNEIGELPELERLELEWPMVASDLAPLLRLSRLAFLSIDSPRKIDDFAPLLQIPSLRTLLITNPKKMANLDWLAEGHHLEVIGIEGGMWTPFKISTLEPLAGLQSLRAFLGTSTKLADQNLMPLAQCPNLAFLGIACAAPRDEFIRLQQARPDLICEWFRDEQWQFLSR